MAVKFAASFGAEVTMLSTSPSKEADARRLGAQHFVLTTDEAQMKPLKNHFDFILNTVSAVHDLNSFLDLLKVEGKMLLVAFHLKTIKWLLKNSSRNAAVLSVP